MSFYPTLVDVLMDRLPRRAGLRGVNILDRGPTSTQELRTGLGRGDVLWIPDGTSTDDVEVLAGPDLLRFTERWSVPLLVQCRGITRADDAARQRARARTIVREVQAELARQNSWPEHVADLDEWDHWEVTPSAQRWGTFRTEDPGSSYTVMCELTLAAYARRTYD